MTITEQSQTPGGIQYVPAHLIQRRVRLERLIYGAAATGLTLAPQFDGAWPAHLTAAGLAVGSVSRLWNKASGEDGWHAFLATCQRLLPTLTGSGIYLANLFTPGTSWWEIALPAGWAAAMGLMAPVTRARHLLAAPALPVLEGAAPETAPLPSTYPEYRAWEWENARSTGTTRLTSVTQYTDETGRQLPDFHGIVLAQTGETVPDLNETVLAAVFDLPVGTVTLHPIDGSGPGRKLLLARPTLNAQQQAAQDPIHRIWNEKIARKGGAAPDMLLTDYRIEPNRIALRTAAPEGQIINLNQKLLARAFEIADASLVMVETDGLGDGLVSLYKTHPLLSVREATAEDLTMAADGTIAIGVRPDGRLARIPLYDPQMGAVTDLMVGAPGAGKSVTLLTILAAERLNGIVSIVADAQDGMSLPEADGRVYHFGKGIAATAATLAASNDLAKYREKISAANGWGSFEPGSPWAIANDTLDELNRILSADAVVPAAFRKWVTGLVGDNQATGRKLGKGTRFAAQSIHLADLGSKDRIRANAKNGTVWLGRTNSSTTQNMARDGVLPPGVTLEPIPRYFKTGSGSDIDAAFEGKEAKNGPITAGMANIIQGGSVFLGRTWNARKENKTYPGLIELMESRPMPRLSDEEDAVFQSSYAKWLAHAEELLSGEGEEVTSGISADQLNEELEHVVDALEHHSGAIKDRILNVLADGPMALKDVRKRLAEEFAAGSVNNAMGELHNIDGLVTPLSRGVYQLTGH